jgi:RNA polymerase sigma factor (sigma-70 family)
VPGRSEVIGDPPTDGGRASPDPRLARLTEILRRAFTASLGPDLGAEALAEALARYVEDGERIRAMANPTGYLFKVGRRRALRFIRPRSSSRRFPPPEQVGMHDVEPGLVTAMANLPDRQRTCVALVHGFQYSQQEVGDLLGISRESVKTHCHRGIASLRRSLGADESWS